MVSLQPIVLGLALSFTNGGDLIDAGVVQWQTQGPVHGLVQGVADQGESTDRQTRIYVEQTVDITAVGTTNMDDI